MEVGATPFLHYVVTRLRAGKPTVLPFRPVGGGPLEWFGIARTEADFRALREGVDAFVGTTWADITPARAPLDGASPVRQALASYSGGRVFRFRGNEMGTFRSLQRLFRVWEARPNRVLRDAQAPGLVRRAFEMALQAGDGAAAAEALRALRASGVLNRRNGLFLEVQQFDALGAWRETLALPDLPDLIASRRPAAVTDALLRAAYHVHLGPHDAAGDCGRSACHVP